ncbi:MAG: DMT family transporter [Solirubrobacterales bacterium]|nr:DMT family transporter [Solirubrobacterales bacterium]
MSSALVALLIVLVGILFASQAPINSGLGRSTGPLAAAFVSFGVGMVALFLIILIGGTIGGLGSIGEVPAWQFTGGLIGATYVALATITISRIGAGVVAATTITGQLACSVAVDHYGWFGIEVHDVTGPRVLGLLLLLGGALAMLYSREEASSSAPVSDRRQRAVFVALIFFSAALVGLQHPINSELATRVGDFPAGFVNFAVGTLLLGLLVLATGKALGLKRIGDPRFYYYFGGLIGVVVVVSSLAAVTEIGAASLTSALVTGQLIGSLVLDRFGAFGLKQIPVNGIRLAAAVALLAGTFLATG